MKPSAEMFFLKKFGNVKLVGVPCENTSLRDKKEMNNTSRNGKILTIR
jgi:hypothetical protein